MLYFRAHLNLLWKHISQYNNNLWLISVWIVFTAIDLKDHVANIDTLLEEDAWALADAKQQDENAAVKETQSE